MKFLEISHHLGATFKEQISHTLWDGKNSILEMRDGGSRQWRQMEWIGFYFQFICEKLLCESMETPGPIYGKTEFDGFFQIPWDFKAHAMNTSSHEIIVNDRNAISSAIEEYGTVGLILAIGEVEYNDDNREFQKWHSKVKGGITNYEKKRKARGAWSRKRKVSFALQQITFIPITEDIIRGCGSFQKGFRNSAGKPRGAKILIDLEKLDEENIHSIDFCESN